MPPQSTSDDYGLEKAPIPAVLDDKYGLEKSTATAAPPKTQAEKNAEALKTVGRVTEFEKNPEAQQPSIFQTAKRVHEAGQQEAEKYLPESLKQPYRESQDLTHLAMGPLGMVSPYIHTGLGKAGDVAAEEAERQKTLQQQAAAQGKPIDPRAFTGVGALGALADTAHLGSEMFTPKGIATTAGAVLANTNPVTAVPVDLAFMAHGAKGLSEAAPEALKGDPQAIQNALLSTSEMTGAAAGLPENVPKFIPAAKTAIAKVGEPFHIGMTGEELLKKGVSPRAQATGWDEAVARPGVQRALVEHNKATPINSAADLDEAIPVMKDKIWTEKVEPALERQGQRPVDMKPVADAIRSEKVISKEMQRFEPEEAAKLNKLADDLSHAETVESANGLLKYVNGKLETYFQKYPSARRANLMNNPETAGWEAARQTIRQQFLKTLEDAGETQVRDARGDYGALETMGKEVERRVNVAERQKPWSLPRILGVTGALPTAGTSLALGELIHHLNKPDVLIRRGVGRLEPPPEAPFTAPPKFTPAAPPPPAATQIPMNLPPENAPLFNIQQTPRLRPDMEAPRLGPITGEQTPLHLPESPEQAPLFSIPQTRGNVPETPKIGGEGLKLGPPHNVEAETAGLPKVKTGEGTVTRGTTANFQPAKGAGRQATTAETAELPNLPNPKPADLKPGETVQDRFFDEKTKQWAPERQANHAAYVEHNLKGKVAPTDRPPEATITIGGTGAGKSTFTRKYLDENPNAVNVDPDRAKLSVPEYEGLKKTDPAKAAFRVHEEASSMSKQLLKAAAEKKMDFLYDTTTGGSDAALYQRLKDAGYHVRIVYVDLPVEEAINRAKLRAESSPDPASRGRVVPENIIRQKHQEAANTFMKFKNDPSVDEIQAYDNSGKNLEPFYNRKGTTEKTYNPETFERVRAKAGANEPKPAGKVH